MIKIHLFLETGIRRFSLDHFRKQSSNLEKKLYLPLKFYFSERFDIEKSMKHKVALITGVTSQDGACLSDFLLKKN